MSNSARAKRNLSAHLCHISSIRLECRSFSTGLVSRQRIHARAAWSENLKTMSLRVVSKRAWPALFFRVRD
eukprot:263321-Rhodomonas_salina.1